MKELIIVMLVATGFLSFAQGESEVRSIEVKGSSEIEITPNEIFVSIALKEYKKGGEKISLDELESNLIHALNELSIQEENLRVQNVYGYNWNWRKKKAEDFLGTKSFLLEVNDLKKVNELIELVDPEGLNNMSVQSYSHSDIETFRKQVKIGAMKAAKDKATYLLGSVDEKLGRILEVQEIDYGYQAPMMRSNRALQEVVVSSNAYESEVDFQKIKIRAEMRVVFEIE